MLFLLSTVHFYNNHYLILIVLFAPIHSITLYIPYPELDVSAGGRLSDNPSAPPNSLMDLKGKDMKNTSE